MLIVDAHLDLAWNALQWNRNLQQSVEHIRAAENHIPEPGRGQGTVSLPEMRKGRVALCFATLLARSTGTPQPHLDYTSPSQAYGVAQGQLAYYKALAKNGEVRLIGGYAELESHIGQWQTWEIDTTSTQPPIGLVISMESADPILSPDQLSAWHEAGVRIIGPAHYGSGRYAGGTSSELGLTSNGIALLHKMEDLNIALDMTHLTDRAFGETIEHFNGTILASHNNCRAIVPHQRQFDDKQIRTIIAREGVIGLALDNWMIHPDWKRGRNKNPQVTLANAVDHIDHICQIAGNSFHSAIGSDLDGGFGREQSPSDLHTIADLQQIISILEKRGYQEKDISTIMHGNWLRLLKCMWV